MTFRHTGKRVIPDVKEIHHPPVDEEPTSLLTRGAPSSTLYHVASQRSHVVFFSNQAPSLFAIRPRGQEASLQSAPPPQYPLGKGGLPIGGAAGRFRGPLQACVTCLSFSTLSPTVQGTFRREGPTKSTKCKRT